MVYFKAAQERHLSQQQMFALPLFLLYFSIRRHSPTNQLEP